MHLFKIIKINYILRFCSIRAKKIFISFHNFPYRTYRNCIVMQQSKKYFIVNIITVKIEQSDLRYFTNNLISSMIIFVN